ncbi:MAG: 5-(carboxyamino)imidazole ribonucleotide synthase, partial [Psychromonas sp.]
FPTVECEFSQEANLVEFLFSPAEVNNEVELKAQLLAKSVVDKMGFIGILAVEMFLLKDGNLLVNEVAPRPHNSGHQTIEGNITSQFEQHLRSILNLPLGSTEITQPSVMLNLLGEKSYEGKAKYQGLEKIIGHKGVNVHLYGKQVTKPFRKMGHITVVAKHMDEAKKLAYQVKEEISVIS